MRFRQLAIALRSAEWLSSGRKEGAMIIRIFHGQVLETTTEDLTRKRKPQKEIPVFWLKIFVCSAVSTTGPTQANALLGAEKLVYGFQETVIP